ncbi:aspartyl/asparaginyl beta-hydroxylase domain-containing protein [Sinimarinibacterium thermocellulolyticum]|uniref:Aspartyl/asparaginyl beta-hydroxylase domain-containing protein n=1 Tax=Sinimarinibacterium thermocellulolyticum TaxID=3170016 RepID=A0ABV2ADS9_9GAMM
MQDPSRILECARAALANGRPDVAEQHYLALLDRAPAHGEALAFVGMRMLRRGAAAQALPLLRDAHAAAPGDAAINENLGIALLRCGDHAAAERHLVAALNTEPRLHRARLMLGKLRETTGEQRQAAIEYQRAIANAQRLGIWLSPESTPRALRDEVLHAASYVRRYQRALVDEIVQPLRARHGSVALRRVEDCMAGYLRERTMAPDDPRQRPKTLFFPGLPAQPYLPLSAFPWLDHLRNEADAIREELIALRENGPDAFRPFLNFSHHAQVERHLRNTAGAAPAWDAFFFYRHGHRDDANHARCPRTSAALEACPLNRIRDQAPEICFSVLTPGTHILPHHGDTNSRVVVHLPLVIPPGCALNVGGERREWRESEPIVFDDTFEHEAWNRGNTDRIVLILDAWNPYLTEAERECLAALVPVLGDFERACQLTPRRR